MARLTSPTMTTAVTALRSAGDWRGVCAAGLVDAHVDLRDVARRHGAAAAGTIEADLCGFAPDLLRRFLPRGGGLALWPQSRVVLSRLPGEFTDATPVLVADLPRLERTRQRIGLRVTTVGELVDNWYDLPAWCWHADAVADRRWAYGASATRLAWHDPSGRSYPQGIPVPAAPVDRADEVEALSALLAAGQATRAYALAGIAVDEVRTGAWHGERTVFEAWLAAPGAALPVSAAETRRLARRYRLTSLHTHARSLVLDLSRDGGISVRPMTRDDRVGGPVAFGVTAPVEVALLRWGVLPVDDLHPLVHESLFPERIQRHRLPGPGPRREFRVRCGSDWHLVLVTGARIHPTRHTDRDIDREFLLAGLGGPISGCAAAVRAFRTGAKPVPKHVRWSRYDLFGYAFHGDTDTVLAVVADGLDPALRDGEGGSLMHWLHYLDHRRVLPALLAAGLQVDEPDRIGNRPAHRAAWSLAEDVVAALVAAGADPAAVDAQGRTAAQILTQVRARAGR